MNDDWKYCSDDELHSVFFAILCLSFLRFSKFVCISLARCLSLVRQFLLLDVVGYDLVNCGVEEPAEEQHHQVDHERVEKEASQAVKRRQPLRY